MSKKARRTEPQHDQIFDFIQKFNRDVTLDEELARQLPTHEFELSFDEGGSVYIDGKLLGVNVNQSPQKGKTHSDKELAESAFAILNDLMGEIHGARIPGYLAFKRPEIFATKHHRFIARVSIGAIVLALRKFDDIWTKQIATVLLSDDLPPEGTELSEEIATRKLRSFCNLVVAHYSQNKVTPKTPVTKIEELLYDQGFASDEEFFRWTRNAVTKIGVVRDRIAAKYGLSKTGTKH